jgi:hypothetical protein
MVLKWRGIHACMLSSIHDDDMRTMHDKQKPKAHTDYNDEIEAMYPSGSRVWSANSQGFAKC